MGCSFQTACVVYVGLGRLGATVVSVIGIVYISQVQTMSTRFADIYSLVHLYLVNSLSLSLSLSKAVVDCCQARAHLA